MNQHLSIQTLLFDIEFYSKEKSHELQNQVSRIFHHNLYSSMVDVFNRFVPEDIIIKKDRLVLDLGNLPFDQLEKELPSRVMKALEEEFFRHFSIEGPLIPYSDASYERITSESNYVSLLEGLLQTGTLPWSVVTMPECTLQFLIGQLYDQGRESLRKLLKRIGRQHVVRKRLAYQTGEDEMARIIEVIEPAESAFILVYKKKIITVQQEQQVVKAESNEFSKAVSLFILTYLLEERGSLFSKKILIRSVLMQMAAHFNIEYTALLNILYVSLAIQKEFAGSKADSLSGLVLELHREASTLLPGVIAGKRSGMELQAASLDEKMSTIRYYLLFGSLPAWSPSYSKEELAAYLPELIKLVPATFREMILSLKKSADIAWRISALFTENKIKQLVNLLAPYGATFIQRYVLLLQKLVSGATIPVQHEREFATYIWKIVLDYIFVHDQETLNKQEFISYSLFHIQQQVHIPALTIVSALADATRQDVRNGMPFADHSLVFRDMLDEYDINKEYGYVPLSYDAAHATQEPGETLKQAAASDVIDLLGYFLRYGSLPWWGKRYFSQSPAALLETIYAASPRNAILLLKKAGLEVRSRKRVLLQFSSSIILKIMAGLPGGDMAKDGFQRIMQFVSGIPACEFAEDAYWERFVLEHLWNNFIQHEYDAFDNTLFYETVLENLSRLTGMAFTELLQSFAIVVEKEEEKMKRFYAADIKLVEERSTKWIWNWVEGAGKRFAQMYIPQRDADPKQQLLDTIDYYLTFHHLPPGFSGLTDQKRNRFLKEMVLYLYHEHQSAFISLIQKHAEKKMAGSSMFGQLFKLIPEVYDTVPFLMNLIVQEQTTQKGSPSSGTHSVMEAFYHLLRWGVLPDWGLPYFTGSPEFLENELSALSTREAIGFMQFADKHEETRKIVLLQIPFRVIKKLVRLMPSGSLACEHVDDLLEVITGMPSVGLTETRIRIMLVQTLLNNYAANNYDRFVADDYYRSVFLQLYSFTGITLEKMLPYFRAVADDRIGSTTAYEKTMKNLHRITEGLKEHSASGNRESRYVDTEIMIGDHQYKQLDLLINGYSGIKTALDPEQRLRSVMNLLDYFLTWNRMPDEFHLTNDDAIHDRLEEMLMLLYHENRDALKSLLNSERHSAKARLRLYDVFSPHKGGDHKKIGEWLEGFAEKDVLRYLKAFAHQQGVPEEETLKPVLDLLISEASMGVAKQEVKALLHSVTFSRFISIQYGDEEVYRLLENYTGMDSQTLQLTKEVRIILLSLEKHKLERDSIAILLNQFNLYFLSGNRTLRSVSEYIKAMVDFFTGFSTYFLNWFEQVSTLESTPFDPVIVKLLRDELWQRIKLDERKSKIEKAIEEEERKTSASHTAEQKKKLESELLRQKQQQEELNQKNEKVPIFDEANKLYIQNAGLVLLHPFLSTYFTRLNLMENGQFVNLESRGRAVHLLQYLAYATTINPEQELVLNKILCNYPLQEPLPLEIIIEQHEADLSIELLQVLIQRSGKLTNSSVDGFRASFLHREGALTETEEAWTLRVEQKSYDVLLQFLPWAFGMIKTSWMDKPLLVEWI